VTLCAFVPLVGCEPTLNWRDVRLESSGLIALFPCRPGREEREVLLAGSTVRQAMQACQADGLTFAVNCFEVRDPVQQDRLMQALVESVRSNLQSKSAQAVEAWRAPGAVAYPAAGRWRISGTGPGGSEVQAELVWFAYGPWVVQAVVIGPTLAADALAPFFDGLRII
jgi:hypothetical protein